METILGSSSGIRSRPTTSCIRCASRKVKCDRQRPCSACVKHKVDCVFNPSQSPRKKRKRAKDDVSTNRFRHYNALLLEKNINPDKQPDAADSEPGGCMSKTQVVHDQGRFKFVDNVLWTRVIQEFHSPEDVLDDHSNDTNELEVSDDDLSFVLTGQPMPNAKPRHPSPEHIHQLWQAYVDNVDPVTKVFHVPTARPGIEKAATNTEAIPRGFEALMFSIYSAAVMSLKDDECRQKFGEPRSDLRSRYIRATKTALSRAKFMGTSNLVVLQALVLHLLSVRDVYEPRAVWSLTGVAVRIAQGMGLERDGEFLGLPPFETEMRRRVWWLLKTHDFRAAELCGLAKFRDLDTSADSTRWPANVNDDQLYPGMTSPATESNTVTDMVFVGLRDELAKFTVGRVAMYRRQGKHPSQWDLAASGNDKVEVDRACKQIEDIFETKYFRYCDPSQPLHLVTMLVGRFALNVIRFLKHHPRRWASIEQTPLSERQLAWEISIKLLEQQSMLQSSPTLKPFSWQSAYFQQWHALIHVLDTLKINPLIEDADKAWQTVQNIYENTPDIIADTKKPIYIAVGNLCLKSYAEREAALQSRNVCLSPTPEFISQLRQQRDILNSQRNVQDTPTNRLDNLTSHGYDKLRNISPKPEANITNFGNGFGYTNFQHGAASRSSHFSQTADTTDDGSFWFNHGFDDSHLYFDEMMRLSSNLMTTQGHSWEEWDALLADST